MWQNPLTQGNVINSLSCPGDEVCYAVGESGTLLKTDNGGQTWVSQNPTTTGNLNGISCSGTAQCMAVGDNSLIVVTSDGGTTWNRRFFNGPVQNLNGVSCPLPETCYVAGARVLLSTNDGGKNWNAAPQPADYYGVACSTPATCYAVGVGGKIQATIGGAAWTLQTVTPEVSQTLLAVNCPALTTCYAVGGGGTLLKTTNGLTWSVLSGTGITSILNGISCPSTDNCTTVGGGSNSSIFTTSNGGVNWQAQETYGSVMKAAACRSANLCYVGGDNGTLLTRKQPQAAWSNTSDGTNGRFEDVWCVSQVFCTAVTGNRVLQTLTGGQLPGGIFGWSEVHKAQGKPNLLSVSCADELNCAAAGFDGYVYYQTDGNGWQEGTRINTEFPPNLFDLACKPVIGDKPTCYGIASLGNPGRIFQSTDGGKSYNPVYSPSPGAATDVALTGISCPETNTCYAVGADGVVLKGGNSSWNRQYTGVKDTFAGISCPDINTCYAVGQNVGLIAGTKDGGLTWTMLNSPQTAITTDLNGISCPTLDICHSVGNSGVIVTTIDGGLNWTTEYRTPSGPVVNKSLLDISCPSSTFCVGAGDGNTSVNTTEGERAWQGLRQGPKNVLSGASCPADTVCFAAGSGVVLYNSDELFVPKFAPALRDISCPNSSTCYAPLAGSTDVLVTLDGGVHWSRENGGSDQLFTISCMGTHACYAGSTGGSIFGYNGGSWTLQPKVVAFNISGISCLNGGVCYAVGSGADFAYLSGGTWSKRPLGGTYSLTAISCPDSATCFASANNGGVLVSKDSGQTWTPKATGLTTSLYDISCPTSGDCAAVGFNGQIVTTRDGGESWTRHATGTNYSLRSVSCSSINRCMVAGDEGTLMYGSLAHSLVVTSLLDNSQATDLGTLSYALKYARAGQKVTFQVPSVTAINGYPQVPYGVAALSSCVKEPGVTINGFGINSIFQLGGANDLEGIKLSGFTGTGLKTVGTGNRLKCVVSNKK